MNIENTNICECMSCIFEELKKCKMNIEKLTEESRNILDKIAEFYKTDIKEAIILTLAIETQYSLDDEDDTVGFNDIRRNIECDVMKIIPFKKQILSLIKKHYFLKIYTLDENTKFKINNQVLDALYKNSFDGISNVGEDFDNKYAFIRRFKNMYETRSQIYFQKLILLSEMEKEFLNIDFVKKMNNLIPEKEDRYIFYDCCGDFLENIQSNLIATLNHIYSENLAKRHAKDIAEGKCLLIENEFLKHNDQKIYV